MKSYKLTKHRVSRNKDVPILMDHELCSGPYDRNSILDGGSSAREIVMRALTKDSLPTDPHIDVDEGADRDLYLWQFVSFGVPRETLAFAETYCRLKERGVKLPPPVLGQSLRSRAAVG